MISFWLICAVMVIVALLFILPPLLQREEKNNVAEVRAANLSVYRDQLRELENDLTNGITSKEQYEQDREEIERRLLADVGGEKDLKRSKPAPSSRNLAYVLALALPVAALLFYLQVGTRQALSATPHSVPTVAANRNASPSNQPGEMTPQRIEANVTALEKKLEQNPNDGAGWSMLARSYSTLSRYKEASAAFEKATALVTNDADLLTEYAYALSMARGQQMEGKPTELLNKALQIDPQNLKALVLAGNAAFKAKKYDQAVSYWQKVLPTLPPKSEVEQSLTEKISEAKRLSKTTSSK
ncbi:MAG: cytochrome biosis protein [Acidobacteria bacterium]|nr:cytochrome biosis protein [Acidobacteriota bacterium]